MVGIGSLLFLSAVCSPHHMGQGMGMGMGLHDGVESYEDSNYITLESFNDTDDSTEPVDFSIPIGCGASFGILGFIISILALKQNNNRDGNIDGNLNENSIYLEPEVNDTISLNRDTLVTNNGYESEIIIVDAIYEQMD